MQRCARWDDHHANQIVHDTISDTISTPFQHHFNTISTPFQHHFRTPFHDGKLVVLTNVLDFSAEHIIERYKSLADIERGFRVLKNDIDIAPVFHRLPERIHAHALICFLALVLYRVMRMRLKAHGSRHSPKTTLELLRRLQKHRVQLGEQHLTGIGKTSPQQLDLFEALGIDQPT